MTLDLKEEMTSLVTDEQGRKSFLVSAVLFPLFPLSFLSAGFVQSLLEDSMKGDYQLPDLEEDPVAHAFKGFSASLIALCYILVSAVPGAVVFMSRGHWLASKAAAEKGFGAPSLVGQLLTFSAGAAAALVVLLICSLIPMALVSFVEDGDFPGAFRLRDIYARVMEVSDQYVKIVILIATVPVCWWVMDFLPHLSLQLHQYPTYIWTFVVSATIARSCGKLYDKQLRRGPAIEQDD